jgi:hypothetical protein
MTAKSNGRAAVRTAKAPAGDLDRPMMTYGDHFPAERETSLNSTCATEDLTTPLSVRAQNVSKELAVELNGEDPPRTGWVPSGEGAAAMVNPSNE